MKPSLHKSLMMTLSGIWMFLFVDPNSACADNAAFLQIGVNEHPTWYTDYQALCNQVITSGVKSVRIGSNWGSLTPSAPGPNGPFLTNTTALAQLDSIVNIFTANGVTIDFVLGYTATWASSQPVPQSTSYYYKPVNWSDWSNFVTAVTNRYKGQITHWEVWNEEDLAGNWYNTVADYYILLKTAALAIHATDPNNRVLLGGLGIGGMHQDGTYTPSYVPGGFLDTLLSQGGANYFDIVNYHYYGNSAANWSAYSGMMAMINKYSIQSKPIWMTETGYTTVGDPTLEAAKADYMTQTYALYSNLPNMEKVFIYVFRDKTTNPTNVSEDNFGMVDRNLNPLPALGLYEGMNGVETNFTLDAASPTLSGSQTALALPYISATTGDGSYVTGTNIAGAPFPGPQKLIPASKYMYFGVNDNWIYQSNAGMDQSVTVNVTYLDTGTTSWSLQYDGTSNAYTSLSCARANSGTWMTKAFSIADAFFGDRQNNSADLRLSSGSAGLVVSDVTIRKPANTAQVVLSSTDAFKLMTHILITDTTQEAYAPPVTMGGAGCREILGNSKYLYFQVSQGFIQPQCHKVSVGISYWDSGADILALQYATASNAYKQVSITKTNTNKWKTTWLTITDASFLGAQNYHGDMRISNGLDGSVEYIASVVVLNQNSPVAVALANGQSYDFAGGNFGVGFGANYTFAVSGSGSAGSGALISSGTGVAYSTCPVVLTGDTLLSGSGLFTLAGPISGPYGLIKGGSSTVILAGSNSYSGPTSINSGILQFNSAASIGGTGASLNIASVAAAGVGFSDIQARFLSRIAVNSPGAVALANNSSENLDFSATGANQPSLALGAIGNAAYSGTLKPYGNTYRLGGGGGMLTLDNTNALTGSCSVVIGGACGGIVAVNAPNNYTGSTTVNSGVLLLNCAGALPGGDVTVSGTLDLNGYSENVSALNGAGRVVSSSTGAVLTVGNGTGSFSGSIGGGSGTISLVKTGTGTLTLSGSCSYTGTTTVAGGTLNACGFLNSAILVSGGVLTGSGTVNRPVTIGTGIESPGTGLAPMLVNGNYTLGASGTYQAQISGTIAAIQYSQVIVTGSSISLSGNLSVGLATGLFPGAKYCLIRNTGNMAIAGSFAGLLEGAIFSAAGSQWSISYVGGAGHDVVLTAFQPPVITSALATSATTGKLFSYQITASNSPSSYGATGLPGGLGLNTVTGLISGTPSSTGSFSSGIAATNASGTGSATMTITVVAPSPPAPTGLTALSGNAQVSLIWNPSIGSTGYNVGRSLVSGSNYIVIAGNNAAASYTDNFVTNGTTYFYLVSAFNSSGTSGPSAETSARPTAPITAGESATPAISISGSTVQVTIANSVIGHTYQLQTTNSLSPASWADIGVSQSGNGNALQLQDSIAPSGDIRRFYRIWIQQ